MRCQRLVNGDSDVVDSALALSPDPAPEEVDTMPRYRLFLVDGTDAGEFRSSVSTWNPGDVIPMGSKRPGWRVVEVADVTEDDPYGIYSAFLVVEPSVVIRRGGA